MRLFFSLSNFAFTMILSLLAFTYTAIYYPTAMLSMFAAATRVRDQISLLGLPDSYMVWVQIFLKSEQIVLVGFSLVMRLIIVLVSNLFWSRPSAPNGSGVEAKSSGNSPFGRW